MEQLPVHIVANIVRHVEEPNDLFSLFISSSHFSKDSIWEHIFSEYNNQVFSRFKGKEYFKRKPELTSLPTWYTRNSSYFKLVLLLKEIEKRNAKESTKTSEITNSTPLFISTIVSPNKYVALQDSFLYTITQFGDVLQFYVYYESYENTYLWIVLRNVNGKQVFLPLLYFMYQHGAGWYGFKCSQVIDLTQSLLGTKEDEMEFLNQFAKHLTCLENGYCWENVESSELQNVDWPVLSKERFARDDIKDPESFWFIEGPSYIEERCLRVYEQKEKERKNAAHIKRRGPVTDEELALWDSFMYKADRGHKDGQFEQEWNNIFERVKKIEKEKLKYLVKNVRSDLGRNVLWCFASRGWADDCKWALEYGADPNADGGKGSPKDIATHYQRKAVLELFSSHRCNIA